MVDLSKCSGKNCPFRDECYRYTATSDSPWQSYISSQYKEGACEYFVPNAEQEAVYYRTPYRKSITWWQSILLWKWLWPTTWVVFMILIYIASL